jgi:1,4-dihydroxy-6-naphthoate synthase
MNNFSLGISPCPNDTYIFGALINHWIESDIKIDDCHFQDVEYLNLAALEQKLDVIKISYFAYSRISEHYQLLTAGGALGKNCGPLLVTNQAGKIPDHTSKIAIPGVNTTANLLLTMALPDCVNKVEYPFSDIESAVLSGEVDFGLIIHESRFTYQHKGLYKVMDLGEYWEEKTNSPLPLGGIAIKRSLPKVTKELINESIRQSILYANNHPAEILDYAKNYAQEMDSEVMMSHINLYVNEFSLDVGDLGKKAAALLFTEIAARFPERKIVEPIFI